DAGYLSQHGYRLGGHIQEPEADGRVDRMVTGREGRVGVGDDVRIMADVEADPARLGGQRSCGPGSIARRHIQDRSSQVACESLRTDVREGAEDGLPSSDFQ